MSEPTHVLIESDSLRKFEGVIRDNFPIGAGGGQIGVVVRAAYDVLVEAEASRIALGGATHTDHHADDCPSENGGDGV